MLGERVAGRMASKRGATVVGGGGAGSGSTKGACTRKMSEKVWFTRKVLGWPATKVLASWTNI